MLGLLSSSHSFSMNLAQNIGQKIERCPLLPPECKGKEQLYLETTAARAASAYAAAIATSVLPGTTVLPETVAESILERARTDKADLIVMATHGRGLFSRAWTGSVTDQLIRRAGVPVLIVPRTDA